MRKHKNQTQQKTGEKGNTPADKDQENGDRRHKETGTHRRAPLSLLSVAQPPSVSHDFRVPPIPSTLSLQRLFIYVLLKNFIITHKLLKKLSSHE